MNPRELLVNAGDLLTHERWNEMVRMIIKLMEGPHVCSPLGVMDGAIYLAQDFEAIDGITQAQIAGRTGGTMTSGQVRLVLARGATLTALTNTASLVTAYNWTGSTIPANARVIMLRIADSYRIIGLDCSGVAP